MLLSHSKMFPTGFYKSNIPVVDPLPQTDMCLPSCHSGFSPFLRVLLWPHQLMLFPYVLEGLPNLDPSSFLQPHNGAGGAKHPRAFVYDAFYRSVMCHMMFLNLNKRMMLATAVQKKVYDDYHYFFFFTFICQFVICPFQ